jgi:hypothetical protein
VLAIAGGDSLLRCSLDASVVVTDASVPPVRIFYFCFWAASGPMGVGAAMLSVDWVMLASLWEDPTDFIFYISSLSKILLAVMFSPNKLSLPSITS